ncbi:MAG: thioredoxin domain-containing protein [Eubacteriales bacterium]|nr:thioredoxin domain-containing protein [Eubacteriales bacterium]
MNRKALFTKKSKQHRQRGRVILPLLSVFLIMFFLLSNVFLLSGCDQNSPIGEIDGQASLAVMRFEQIDQDFSGIVYREVNNFAALLNQTETPILIAVYHPLGQTNAQIIPALEQLADDYQDQLMIIWVDGTIETKIASDFGAESLPQFTMLVHSEVKRTLVGFAENGAEDLQILVESYIGK